MYYDDIARKFSRQSIAIRIKKTDINVSKLLYKVMDKDFKGTILMDIIKNPKDAIIMLDFDDVQLSSEKDCRNANRLIIDFSDIQFTKIQGFGAINTCEDLIKDGYTETAIEAFGESEVNETMYLMTGGNGDPGEYGDN